MQKAFFVSNRNTQAPDYLEHRSILKIYKCLPNLNTIDLRSMEIIDVDKFIYIYYLSDDDGMQFRTDMGIFRQLVSSPFFHVQSALFIFVNDPNTLLDDIVRSACRDSNLTDTKNNLEIIHHEGQLVLNDLASYITGTAIGNDTASTYRTVYITESDVREKIRFDNEYTGLDQMLPQVTDMAEAYRTRASNEALTSSRMVKEDSYVLPVIDSYSDLTSAKVEKTKCLIVTGDKFSKFSDTVNLLYKQFDLLGLKIMVLNLDTPDIITPDFDAVLFKDISHSFYPRSTVSVFKAKQCSLGYFISNLDNIHSIDLFIIVIPCEVFVNTCGALRQLCDETRIVYVMHNLEESMKSYIDLGIKSDTIFINRNIISEDFDILSYRDVVGDSICAYFPESIDLVDEREFFDFCVGGMLSDGDR